MKKKAIKKISLAVVSIVALAGCSDSNFDEKKVYVNGELFGKTIATSRAYETGEKLFNSGGEYVGFIDNDNIVYKSSVESPTQCGGEYVGLCEYSEDGSNMCSVSGYEEHTGIVENGEVVGELVPPYFSFECGERI